MPGEMKTFRVACAHCKLPFHVRFPLAGSDPANPGDTGEVVVQCLHCRKDVMIAVPRATIATEVLLRSAAR